MQAGQQDIRYMDIVYRLQQGVGTGTCDSTCTSTDACTGTSSGTSTNGSACTGTSAGAQGMDYCLTTNGLVRFRDKVYVSGNSELEKVILREFHAKPYSGHPSY